MTSSTVESVPAFSTPEHAWRAMSRSLIVSQKHIAYSAHKMSMLVLRTTRSEARDLLKQHPPASFQELLAATLFEPHIHPDTFEEGLEGQSFHGPSQSTLLQMVHAEPIQRGVSAPRDPLVLKNYGLEENLPRFGDLCSFLYLTFEYSEGVFTTFWKSRGVLWSVCADYTVDGGLHLAPADLLPIPADGRFCILRNDFISDWL